MPTIFFETHATSLDNEAGLASGHYDVALSKLGEEQAREMASRYASRSLGAVYCSDLQRSFRTAELAFHRGAVRIIRDSRLRECDYGQFTRWPTSEIGGIRSDHIDRPFPSGESYRQAKARVGEFLRELRAVADEGAVLLIGHRATQYALEHWLRGVPLERAVVAPWEWQPGWTYHLKRQQASQT